MRVTVDSPWPVLPLYHAAFANSPAVAAASRSRFPTVSTLLRFLTCGSVDDGKSTLIGRMLFDAGLIPRDQLAAIERASSQRGYATDLPDLSLLMDGLLDERAQGITIDVAWRYFQTARRKFIMGDAPGHEQYTRNMATAASQCDLALILIDARKGVLPQTRRHAAIASLLGIQQVVVAVNKMDLTDWSEDVFTSIRHVFLELAQPLGIRDPIFIPVSALNGDNVVTRSPRMRWYQGPPLLQLLEEVDGNRTNDTGAARLPVQWVVRSDDFRGYAGTVAGGSLRVGDQVKILPGGSRARIRSLVTFEGEIDRVLPGQAVTATLSEDMDVSRGDTIVAGFDAGAVATDRLEAELVWFDERPLLPGRRYELRIGTTAVPATVKRLIHRLNLETLREEAATQLGMNDIGRCDIMLERQVHADLYRNVRETGGLILIDRMTNATVAAGMVSANGARQVFWEQITVDKAARAAAKGQVPRVLWFTGLSGAGKSTVANAVESELHRRGMHTYLIDGDNIRHGLCQDLGFSEEDRIENTRRAGEVAKLMVDAGLIVIVSLISPFRAERRIARDLLPEGEFIEIYMNTPLTVCESRDRKGLYKLAREGKIQNFTGISSPYEPPENPEIVLDTSSQSVDACVALVLDRIK